LCRQPQSPNRHTALPSRGALGSSDMDMACVLLSISVVLCASEHGSPPKTGARFEFGFVQSHAGFESRKKPVDLKRALLLVSRLQNVPTNNDWVRSSAFEL